MLIFNVFKLIAVLQLSVCVQFLLLCLYPWGMTLSVTLTGHDLAMYSACASLISLLWDRQLFVGLSTAKTVLKGQKFW